MGYNPHSYILKLGYWTSTLLEVVANIISCVLCHFGNNPLKTLFTPVPTNFVTKDLLSFVQLMPLATGKAVRLSSWPCDLRLPARSKYVCFLWGPQWWGHLVQIITGKTLKAKELWRKSASRRTRKEECLHLSQVSCLRKRDEALSCSSTSIQPELLCKQTGNLWRKQPPLWGFGLSPEQCWEEAPRRGTESPLETKVGRELKSGGWKALLTMLKWLMEALSLRWL